MGRPAGFNYSTLEFLDGSGRGLPRVNADQFVDRVLAMLKELAKLPDKVVLPTIKKHIGLVLDPESTEVLADLANQRCLRVGWSTVRGGNINHYYFTDTKHLLHLHHEKQVHYMGGAVLSAELSEVPLDRGHETAFRKEIRKMYDVLSSGYFEMAAEGMAPYETDAFMHVLVTIEKQLNDVRRERVNAVEALDKVLSPVSKQRAKYRTLFGAFYDS